MFSGLVNSANCSDYHAIDHCENTRGIDNLLTVYNMDREVITNAMINNPQYLVDHIWTSESPLSYDNDCKCKMGYGNRHTASICAQCTNLRRVIDLRTDVHNRPFTIECGSCVGKKLTVIATAVDRPFLIWDIKGGIRTLSYMLQQSQHLPMTANKWIVGDSFTMLVLQTCMINKLMNDANLPHSIKLHTAFICDNTGYMLNEASSIGSFDNLQQLYGACSAEHIMSIVLQLLVTLTELSKVKFSHGNPTINALLFDKQPVSYKHNNVYVRGQFTVKLTDLAQSSATYNNTVYTSCNESDNMVLERSIFMPEIVHDGCWYKLTAATIDIYQAMCHTGLPLFASSFDFYSLFISLVMKKNVYATVCEDKKLNNLWTMLWQPHDLLTVQRRLITSHSDCKNVKPTDILKSIWLRCDVLNTMWSVIKCD